MSYLMESLNKFNQQQQKCQSTLTSIAKRAAPPQPNSHAHLGHSAVVAKPTSTPVKFSKDTERLQLIDNIRKSPIGAQLKLVIDLLLDKREALTPDEIKAGCYVDVKANKDVFDSLKKNPKVTYDGYRFSYKSTYALKNKDQLLTLIQKHPDGISGIDLKDSYPSVMKDLQSLKASKDIWLISTLDSQEDIAYPNDHKASIKVDDDLKLFFRSIELPREMADIEKELQKYGMKPATNSARRKAMEHVNGIIRPKPKQKKKRRISKRTKLTNSHMPELFNDDMFID